MPLNGLNIAFVCVIQILEALYLVSNEDSASGKMQSRGLVVDPELVPDKDTLAKYADYPMLLMECVRIMLEQCSENAVMFRKCGGAHCVHSLVKYESSRGGALKIIQELILNHGRDDLGLFNCVLCSELCRK